MKPLNEALREAAKELHRTFDADLIPPPYQVDPVLAVLRALNAAGWPIVPRVATEEMVRAGVSSRIHRGDEADIGIYAEENAAEVWSGMLAAAPKLPPAPPARGGE